MDTFRRYKGIEVLIEMLKLYRDPFVAQALTHTLKGNGKQNNTKILFILYFG